MAGKTLPYKLGSLNAIFNSFARVWSSECSPNSLRISFKISEHKSNSSLLVSALFKTILPTISYKVLIAFGSPFALLSIKS
jgi:hypothetical protein